MVDTVTGCHYHGPHCAPSAVSDAMMPIPAGEESMERKIGHYVSRPGTRLGDPPLTFPVAKDLATVPGSPTRPEEVTFFSREHPLESVAVEESASADWARDVRDAHSPEVSELYARHQRAMGQFIEWAKAAGDLEPIGTPTGEDVTESIRHRALELGYGEVGFTRFDRYYVYESRRSALRPDLPHAICLALEQEYAPTQTIPSLEAETAHGETYERQSVLTVELADYIRSLGYRVQVSGPAWYYGPVIPMFVAAGLGQLGHNGQLLSPRFGSRARLQIILTDAKVTYDRPVDYGIHNFCRQCQICVRRCPGRALTGEQLWYRGVEKAKLIFKRCRPVMARYSGCGVCMKVCPIQRYGMKPVMEHYVATGEVLGKGTQNLEGYTLPDKGYFGPRQLPHFDTEFFDMPRGRAEDSLLAEFKSKLLEAERDGNEDLDGVWAEFRSNVEEAVKRRSVLVDMGMDLSE